MAGGSMASETMSIPPVIPPGIPPVLPPVTSPVIRQKTEMCKLHQLGACLKGEACSFAHSAEELAQDTGTSSAVAAFDSAELAKRAAAAAEAARAPRKSRWDEASDAPAPVPMGVGFTIAPTLQVQQQQVADGFSELQAGEMANGYDGYKYKTQPCKFYLSGQCQKGDQCTYSHEDPSALQAKGLPELTPEAKLWKTRMCAHFPTGKCSRGDSCSFAHSLTELTPQAREREMSAQAGNPDAVGKGYKIGRGGKPVPPSNFKTIPCKFFPLGKCTKGNDCTFAHSTDDLRAGGVHVATGANLDRFGGTVLALQTALAAMKEGKTDTSFAQWDNPGSVPSGTIL